MSIANFNDWHSRSRAFADLALFKVDSEPIVLGIGDASLQAREATVTPNLFGLLGIDPAIGRGFRIVPERRGALDDREVIVSHALWKSAFGGDPTAIGREVRVEGTGTDITRMFLKQAVGPICVGVALGTAGAFALGRLIQALLFGVSPRDAVSYMAAASMLVCVALGASYLPVRRVLQGDPGRALRG